MQQFSTNNSVVELEILSGYLLFSDPLYFQKIIDSYDKINISVVADKKELVKAFEEQLFPHGGGGLLGYKYIDSARGIYLFDPKQLRKFETDNAEQESLARQKLITTFGLDTDSFLIIDMHNIDRIIRYVNYDDLIDALLSKQLDKYFETINEKLENNGWAFVVSNGMDSNAEFSGDGFYIVD
jgi:hypothetical protein